MFLTIIGKLGGRKWLTTVLTSILTPILAMYLPIAVVVPVIGSLTALAVSFIFAQGAVDKATNGASSTSVMIIKTIRNKKNPRNKTFKEMSKEYKNKKK